MGKKYEFPEGWSNDPVSKHIDAFMQNCAAFYQEGNPHNMDYSLFVELDSIYREILEPNIHEDFLLEAVILLRTHAAYIGSVTLAMGGMVPESFMVIRGVLETGLYALHINKHQEAGDIWVHRKDNNETLRQCKREFSYRGKLLPTLEDNNLSLAKTVDLLYQRTIEFGAHPNESFATANMQIEEETDETRYSQSYLAGGTLNQAHSLKTCAQVSACVLSMFEFIFTERFQILGLDYRLTAIKERYGL